jgi:hypothetical protein
MARLGRVGVKKKEKEEALGPEIFTSRPRHKKLKLS